MVSNQQTQQEAKLCQSHREEGSRCTVQKKKTPRDTTSRLTDRGRNHSFLIIEREEAPGPVRAFSWPKLNHPRGIPFPRAIKARMPTETPGSDPQTTETRSGILDRHLGPFWGWFRGRRAGPGPRPAVPQAAGPLPTPLPV